MLTLSSARELAVASIREAQKDTSHSMTRMRGQLNFLLENGICSISRGGDRQETKTGEAVVWSLSGDSKERPKSHSEQGLPSGRFLLQCN